MRYLIHKGLVVLAALTVLSGCGVNPGATSSSVAVGRLQGTVHGGANPIVGATVTLYETQVGASSTYGSAGKVLATATTGSYGDFVFSNTGPGAYTCDTTPYMQYAYVAITGGSTGGNSTNNNSVLMAAIGPCSDMATITAQSSTVSFISEATTAAAAYALGNFMKVTGALGNQVVQIGSTPTNDATTPSCTGTGSSMSCTADGLGHAFANAVGLASSVTFSGNGLPTGQINTSMPGYTGSVIPQAMLNIVADALQACVNSGGGAAGDIPADNCGALFTATTPSAGTAPTDTLSAAINIALYPSNAATTSSTTGIFSLISAFDGFQPTLSTAPTDYTLGVFYPGGTNFPYSWGVTLDIADNVYVLAANGNTTTASTSTTVSSTGIASVGYNASGQTALLYGYSGNADTSGNYILPGTIAVDSLENVYISNPGLTASTSKLREYTGSSGALASTIAPVIGTSTAETQGYSLAVDRLNSLWMGTLGNANGSSPQYKSAIFKVPASGSITNYSGSSVNAIRGLAIDTNQNIWGCNIGGAAGASSNAAKTVAFPNAGGTAGSTLYSGLSAATSGKLGYYSGAAAIDASGNVYCPLESALTQAIPTATSGVVSGSPSVNAQTYNSANTANLPAGAEFDGNNIFYIAGNSQFGRFFGFNITAAATATTPFTPVNPTLYDPCYPVSSSGSFYCSYNTTAFPSTYYDLLAWTSGFQIDSAGSVWLAVGTNSAALNTAGLVQIIGPVAPTWSQLSYGKPGQKP